MLETVRLRKTTKHAVDDLAGDLGESRGEFVNRCFGETRAEIEER